MKERGLKKEMAMDREIWRGDIRGNRPTRALVRTGKKRMDVKC